MPGADRHSGRSGPARPPRPDADQPRHHTATGGKAAGTAPRHDRTGATGTETPNTPPENRRTAQAQPHQPPHAPANADAAGNEAKPATTTTPENERTDRRNRQRTQPAHSAEPTTDRHGRADSGGREEPRDTTNEEEEEATTHPQAAATPGTTTAPRRAPRTCLGRPARGHGRKAEGGAWMRRPAKAGQG